MDTSFHSAIGQLSNTISKEVTITNSQGLHLRPCSMLAQTIQKFSSQAKIYNGDASADLRGILLNIVSICAEKDDVVRLEVEGEDAEEAMEALLALFAIKFEEDEFAPSNE